MRNGGLASDNFRLGWAVVDLDCSNCKRCLIVASKDVVNESCKSNRVQKRDVATTNFNEISSRRKEFENGAGEPCIVSPNCPSNGANQERLRGFGIGGSSENEIPRETASLGNNGLMCRQSLPWARNMRNVEIMEKTVNYDGEERMAKKKRWNGARASRDWFSDMMTKTNRSVVRDVVYAKLV